MRAFVVNGRAVLTSASKNLKEWRNLIAYAARDNLPVDGPFSYGEAVQVDAKFFFVRPKSHLKKNGELTKSAPRSKHSKPDVDKLARAVLDALTGVYFDDDSQVVRLTVTKEYALPGENPGLEIQVDKHQWTDE